MAKIFGGTSGRVESHLSLSPYRMFISSLSAEIETLCLNLCMARLFQASRKTLEAALFFFDGYLGGADGFILLRDGSHHWGHIA